VIIAARSSSPPYDEADENFYEPIAIFGDVPEDMLGLLAWTEVTPCADASGCRVIFPRSKSG
jgi:hypothetical protein